MGLTFSMTTNTSISSLTRTWIPTPAVTFHTTVTLALCSWTVYVFVKPPNPSSWLVCKLWSQSYIFNSLASTWTSSMAQRPTVQLSSFTLREIGRTLPILSIASNALDFPFTAVLIHASRPTNRVALLVVKGLDTNCTKRYWNNL